MARLLTICAGGFVALGMVACADARDVIIHAGTLIDGLSATPREHM